MGNSCGSKKSVTSKRQPFYRAVTYDKYQKKKYDAHGCLKKQYCEGTKGHQYYERLYLQFSYHSYTQKQCLEVLRWLDAVMWRDYLSNIKTT